MLPSGSKKKRRNAVEIENFKRALQNKANELRSSQISKDQIAIERNAELLDEIQRTSDREIAMTFMTKDWQTAMLVTEALKRIDLGEYGVCIECDEQISERRLKAIPWAKFCIRCQEKADNEAALFELQEAA